MKAWNLRLPFPPSVNGYWRSITNRRTGRPSQIISKKGRKFRTTAIQAIIDQLPNHVPIAEKLAVHINFYPPCNRKRDIDNYIKAAFDALTHAEFWIDDNQVDEIRIVRKPKDESGKGMLTLMITEKVEGEKK